MSSRGLKARSRVRGEPLLGVWPHEGWRRLRGHQLLGSASQSALRLTFELCVYLGDT